MRPPPRRLLQKRVTRGEALAWETVRALIALVNAYRARQVHPW